MQERGICGAGQLTKVVGRLFGFLLGTVLAGGGLYYYVVDEYKVSNELLVEDIYVRISLASRDMCATLRALDTD